MSGFQILMFAANLLAAGIAFFSLLYIIWHKQEAGERRKYPMILLAIGVAAILFEMLRLRYVVIEPGEAWINASLAIWLYLKARSCAARRILNGHLTH